MSALKVVLVTAVAMIVAACSSQKTTIDESVALIETKADDRGKTITVEVVQGPQFKDPLIVIWLENEKGGFLQTLYVSKSFATGVFRYGVMEEGKWKKGLRRHPSALPYFCHKFGNRTLDGIYLPTEDNPVPDAVSGATPTGSFTLKAKSAIVLKRYKILLEINQPWDFNSFWFNDKYSGDIEFQISGQPALVYAADIDTKNSTKEFILKPIGHSSYNGSHGLLNIDTSTLTTALQMLEEVKVIVE